MTTDMPLAEPAAVRSLSSGIGGPAVRASINLAKHALADEQRSLERKLREQMEGHMAEIGTKGWMGEAETIKHLLDKLITGADDSSPIGFVRTRTGPVEIQILIGSRSR